MNLDSANISDQINFRINTCWAKCVGRGPTGPPGPEGFPLGLADPGLEGRNWRVYFLKYAFMVEQISPMQLIASLTCKSPQICLESDWASQRTGTLSFPSESPVRRMTDTRDKRNTITLHIFLFRLIRLKPCWPIKPSLPQQIFTFWHAPVNRTLTYLVLIKYTDLCPD